MACERLSGQILSYDDYEKLRARLAPSVGRLHNFFFMEWNALDRDRLLVRPFRTTYSLINHDSCPNLQVNRDGDALFLTVIRDIPCDREFTLDYTKEPLPRGYFDTPYLGYLVPAFPASASTLEALHNG